MQLLKLFIAVVALIAVVIAVIVVLSSSGKQKVQISGPIVFFGNSITAGNGVEKPFPELIGEELGVETINAGVSGDTTENALLRLEEDVISKNPFIVVVIFGGNDYLQGVPFDTTAKNFNVMLTQLTQETDARIIIAAVRADVLKGTYEKLQKDVAEVYDVEFVPNIMKGMYTGPDLMLDSVHPNQKGHQKIAEILVKEIRPLLN